MKLALSALVLAASFAAILAAHAGDNPAATRPTEVRGVKLASICTTCGVVSATRVETRTGKGTGAGAVGGAVVGGLAGHQIGRGSGNKVATVLGAIGGGVAGNAIEKNVKKETIWLTTVTFKDGTTDTYEQKTDPGLDAGDVVTVHGDRLVKRAP
jgi:outer membrane lipoprotein SlyB